jgi:uncharacterized protein
MSSPRLPAVRLGEGEVRITVGVAAMTWLLSWLGGNVLGSVVVAISGEDPGEVDTPVWLTVAAAVSLWVPMLVALREVSLRYGTGSPAEDYGLSVRPVDLVGVPVGILSQLVLLPLVYWPLEGAWPDTFSRPRLEESARTLYDSAEGLGYVALVLVVVAGAPVVEELMYRGLLQGALVRRVDDLIGVVVAAAWFALIHFRPVEYPGLFAFGLVLGSCALLTGRLGMPILAHVAFNATGLAWVATR